MNPLLIGALVGGGMGMLRGQQDQKNFREEQRLNAIKALYSPWTGIGPTNPQRPNAMNPVMQGALSGFMMGQQFDPAAPAQQAPAIADPITSPNAGNPWMFVEPKAPGGGMGAPILY